MTTAAQVFVQIRKAPNFEFDSEQSWRARPYMELQATADKKYMELVDEANAGWWPVYKGASFDIWLPDTGTYYAWARPEKILKRLQSKRLRGNRNRRSVYSEFPRAWAQDRSTYPALKPRIAIRDVTRVTDSRTLRLALVPPFIVAQHTVPFLIWPRGDEKDEAYLLGTMSSIPLDWYARRFVELHMNFHIVNTLPVPRPGTRQSPLAAGRRPFGQASGGR